MPKKKTDPFKPEKVVMFKDASGGFHTTIAGAETANSKLREDSVRTQIAEGVKDILIGGCGMAAEDVTSVAEYAGQRPLSKFRRLFDALREAEGKGLIGQAKEPVARKRAARKSAEPEAPAAATVPTQPAPPAEPKPKATKPKPPEPPATQPEAPKAAVDMTPPPPPIGGFMPPPPAADDLF